MEQAWDENLDPFSNTVKVTITRLRRKLGLTNIIHTTPGIGGRLQRGTPRPDVPSAARPDFATADGSAAA